MKFGIRTFSVAYLLMSTLFMHSGFSEEVNCPEYDKLLEQKLPDVQVPELFDTKIKATEVCFDPQDYKTDKDLIEEFKLISTMGVLDERNCLIEDRLESSNGMISKFIQKHLERKKVNVVAKVHPVDKDVKVVYTTSVDPHFIDTALTKKDKWQIAGTTVGSIVIGALVSEKIYKGEPDKRLHWKYGAVINGVTTGATYLLIEEAGLGDKLGLSRKARKNVIMYSGPVASLVIGIAKEIFYDRKRRDRHTVDANDAVATALGGGAFTPLVINLAL